MYLFGRIMYWIGAFCTMFPLFLMDIPTWAFIISAIVILIIQGLFPDIATVIQSILWIIGIVILFTKPFPMLMYIIAPIAFAYWLVMQILYYKYMRNK